MEFHPCSTIDKKVHFMQRKDYIYTRNKHRETIIWVNKLIVNVSSIIKSSNFLYPKSKNFNINTKSKMKISFSCVI